MCMLQCICKIIYVSKYVYTYVLMNIAITGTLFRVRYGVKPAIGGLVLGTLIRYIDTLNT